MFNAKLFELPLYFCNAFFQPMKNKIILALLSLSVFISCKKDEQLLLVEQQKEVKKREAIFATINKSWNFNAFPLNQSTQSLNQNWAEWRVFLKELSEKPKTSIGAFQKKAKTLSKKAAELNNNIPATYNKPEIKSRISAVTTKINTLNLYINLNSIPDQKIVKLIPEINQEVESLQQQFAEIDTKNQIKIEDGEADMIRMLDTTRAISSKPIEQNPSAVQPSSHARKRFESIRNKQKPLNPKP